ncbi:MAG TPA: efflux RND transporter permease subunit, partial [Prolixibacteraceae bacterium]|nr:efflux RND transporter permease subunit [Prolixibacteraceae bacterium]
GMNKWKAASEGTREIFFAVISTSLTLAIVFIPVIFLQGFTGRLFREFGIVVASAIMISALVSLTLTPVLNVKLGGSASHHSPLYLKTESFFVAMEKGYRKALKMFIGHKWASFSILGLCILIIVWVGLNLQSELAPMEDHSFIRTSITAPEGMEFNATKKITDEIAEMQMNTIPELNFVLARHGGWGGTSGNSGFIMTMLTDPDDRTRTQQEIYDELSKKYSTIAGARVIASQEPTIATAFSRGLPVQYVIQNIDFEKIREALPRFMEEAEKSDVFSVVDVNLKFNKPELNIVVDRLKTTSLGVNTRDVTDALNTAFSGGRTGYFLRNNKQYFVIAQVDREDRDNPADISKLYVRNRNGEMIQLDNLVKVEENSNPPTLYHFNRYKSATVAANLAAGYSLGDGIDEMNRIAEKVLDSSFNTDLSGPSRDFAESSSNISFALILALMLVYLVLAAQFESFRDPFIIMLTVPMAIAGALLSLHIFGHTLNIFSEIGMLLLIGIVTKNGILIVEFANQKQRAGQGKAEAAFEAAAARLRPILMTSLATVFGALPIALALGSGAESRIPLGIVVVGGILFSLLLTLFVIPVMYIVMSGKKKRATIDFLSDESAIRESEVTPRGYKNMVK